MQGWSKPEEDARHQRQQHSEGQHGPRDSNIARPRDRAGVEFEDEFQSEPRQEDSGNPAGDGQDRTLGEQLFDQVPALGTQGGAHGHLPLPGQGAREQEIGDVGHRDQEQEGDRTGEHRQGGAEPGNNRIEEWLKFDVRADLESPVVQFESLEFVVNAPLKHIHLRFRLYESHVFFQACNDGHDVPPTSVDGLGHVCDGNPHVRIRVAEPFRHDADDFIDVATVVLEGDGPSDNLGVVVEMRSPQAMTDHHHATRTGNLLLRKKAPAEHRLQPKHLEKTVRDKPALQAIGLLAVGVNEAPGYGAAVIGRQTDRFEDGVLFPPVHEVRGRSLVVIAVGKSFLEIPFPNKNDAIRIRVVQRLEEHSIDDRKHDRGRTDADREGENRHGREAGILAQEAEGETKVVHVQANARLMR